MTLDSYDIFVYAAGSGTACTLGKLMGCKQEKKEAEIAPKATFSLPEEEPGVVRELSPNAPEGNHAVQTPSIPSPSPPMATPSPPRRTYSCPADRSPEPSGTMTLEGIRTHKGEYSDDDLPAAAAAAGVSGRAEPAAAADASAPVPGCRLEFVRAAAAARGTMPILPEDSAAAAGTGSPEPESRPQPSANYVGDAGRLYSSVVDQATGGKSAGLPKEPGTTAFLSHTFSLIDRENLNVDLDELDALEKVSEVGALCRFYAVI